MIGARGAESGGLNPIVSPINLVNSSGGKAVISNSLNSNSVGIGGLAGSSSNSLVGSSTIGQSLRYIYICMPLTNISRYQHSGRDSNSNNLENSNSAANLLPRYDLIPIEEEMPSDGKCI